MKNIIQQIDGWYALTAEEIRGELSTIVGVPVETPVTISDLQAAVGDDSAALVVATIKAAQATNPLMEPALIALSTTGMLLNSDGRQAMIDELALAGEWSPELQAAVKGLGVRQVTNWVALGGIGSVPTLEEITAALAKIEADTIAAETTAKYRTVHSGHIAPVLDSDTRTTAELVAAFRAAATELEAQQ